MYPISQFEELSIALIDKSQSSHILNLKFLKECNIVPSDWQLTSSIFECQTTYFEFTNGIAIATQPTRIIFSQNLIGKANNQIEIPVIARNYVASFLDLEYEAIEINVSTLMAFGARKHLGCYIYNTCASSVWQESGEEQVLASLKLKYPLKRGKFNLVINDIKLQNLNGETEIGSLITGSFYYVIAGSCSLETMKNIYLAIANWQHDLMLYREVVNDKFLNRQLSYAN